MCGRMPLQRGHLSQVTSWSWTVSTTLMSRVALHTEQYWRIVRAEVTISPLRIRASQTSRGISMPRDPGATLEAFLFFVEAHATDWATVLAVDPSLHERLLQQLCEFDEL